MLAIVSGVLLLHSAHSHSSAVRERTGTSWRVGGRFDGFASLKYANDRADGDALPRADGLGQPITPPQLSPPQPAVIRVNATTLVATSSCAWSDACGTNGAWVRVSGTCGGQRQHSADSGWWVGLFPASASEVRHVSPASLGNMSGLDPILSPPFVLPAPLKFQRVSCASNLSKSTAGTNPGADWWVPRTASGPLVFVLMSGGASATSVPIERARSVPVQFTEPSSNAPMHIRLAHVRNSSSSSSGLSTRMRVSWTSSTPSAPKVHWGMGSGHLNNTVLGFSSGSYTPDDMCGQPARNLGWWEPGFMLSAVVDLARSGTLVVPGDTVYYQVSSGGFHSAVKSFTAIGIGPHTSVTAVLTADMGATTPDFVEQHWAENDAFATTALMAKLVDRGFRGSTVSLALNVGDLSYATGYLGKWETFMNAISPVSERVPYMVGQGNHEQDWPATGSVAMGPELGKDSGGECGVPTAARFLMPTPRLDEQLMWYSFDQGPVHFIMVNTELPISSPAHAQWQWLEVDLANIDRMHTPWCVVLGHRPMFSGRPASGDGTQDGRLLETLLIKWEVDLTIAGHIHYAQRSCAWRHGQCVKATVKGGYDGPVHIVAGNGGQSLNNATIQSEQYPYTGSGCHWSEPNCSRSTRGMKRGSGSEFGMSAFTANRTDFTWSFLGTNDSRVHHTFTLKRAYPRIKLDEDEDSMAGDCTTVPLSCRPNCATAIVSAAQACSSRGGGIVHLVAGTYHLNPETDSGKGRGLSGLVQLHGLSNVAIIGSAGTGELETTAVDPAATILMIHGMHGGFVAKDCANLTFANLHLDYSRLPYTYGRAGAVGATQFVLEINQSTYPFPSGSSDTGGSSMQWLNTAQGIVGFDREHRRIADHAVDIGGKFNCSLDKPGGLTVTGAGTQHGIRAGSEYIIRHQIYAYNGFTFTNVGGVMLRRVQIWSAAGMGFLFRSGSRDIRLLGCGVRRRLGRPMSTNADAAHFAEVSGVVHIDNCTFEGQGDDGINIHGFFHDVRSKNGSTFVLGNRPVGGTAPLHVGEKYEFRNRSTWRVEAVGLMLSAANPDGIEDITQIATFDFGSAAATAAVSRYALMVDVQRTPESVLIENSVFSSSRARGALIKASHVIVRNNIMEFTADHCIMAFPDGCAFYESGAISNWTIESNTFRGCGAPELQDGRPTAFHQRSDIFAAACVPRRDTLGLPTEQGAPISLGRPFHGGRIVKNNFEQSHYAHPAVALYGFDDLEVAKNIIQLVRTTNRGQTGAHHGPRAASYSGGFWARSLSNPDVWWISPGNFSRHYLSFSCTPCGGIRACASAVHLTDFELEAIAVSDPFSCGLLSRLLVENSVRCNVSDGNVCDGRPCGESLPGCMP